MRPVYVCQLPDEMQREIRGILPARLSRQRSILTVPVMRSMLSEGSCISPA